MSKHCKCLNCPHFEISYQSGIITTNCFYTNGKKDTSIFMIDTSKGTPKGCPLKEKENEMR
jgi:hypothetical protein